MNNTSLLDLILSVRSGDQQNQSFAKLVKLYTPLINKKVSSFFKSESDIEEAWQEARIALHSAAVTYDVDKSGEVTFGLYAGVCIVNRLKSFLRLRKRDTERTEYSYEEVASEGSDFEDFLASGELCERVMKIARTLLSELEYTVFELQLEGYPTREIAKRLNREPKSVDNAKARISRRLRESADICTVLADIF